MTRATRAALAALALAAGPAPADDPKPGSQTPNLPPAGGGKGILAPRSPYTPAGTATGKLAAVSTGGGTITLAVPQIEPDRIGASGRVYVKAVDKEFDYALADDVKVRFRAAPKPVPPRDGLLGYKADLADLHAGQVVTLTLGKKASPGASLAAVKPVVTMVMIERDAPPPKDPPNGDRPKR